MPIEKQHDEECQQRLNLRLAPFILRRTKAQVATELPPKTEITRRVVMEGRQRELYEGLRLSLAEELREVIAQRGIAHSGIVVLDALLKLRQVCCDPRLVKLEAARGVRESAKFDLLMDMLPALLDEGRKVLLFSQFTGMLKLIAAELDRRRIRYVTLTGETRDRAEPVQRFQNGEVPLFLLSLKAGGVGLNLTAADTVIHYDPWWNPAAEAQASDRAHRIGQDKPVFVFRLITSGTVEERIEELKRARPNSPPRCWKAAAAAKSSASIRAIWTRCWRRADAVGDSLTARRRDFGAAAGAQQRSRPTAATAASRAAIAVLPRPASSARPGSIRPNLVRAVAVAVADAQRLVDPGKPWLANRARDWALPGAAGAGFGCGSHGCR